MSRAGRFYGRERFDPLRHLARMCAMQASLWVAYWLPTFMGCALIGYEERSAITLVLSSSLFSPWTSLGWTQIFAACIAAVGVSVAVWRLVGRLRRAVDFVATAYFFHFLVVSAVDGFPLAPTWWLVHAAAVIGACSLGEFLCMRREMQEISV